MTSVWPGNSFESARRRARNTSAFLIAAIGFEGAGFHSFIMKSSSAAGGAESWLAVFGGVRALAASSFVLMAPAFNTRTWGVQAWQSGSRQPPEQVRDGHLHPEDPRPGAERAEAAP